MNVFFVYFYSILKQTGFDESLRAALTKEKYYHYCTECLHAGNKG